MKCPHCNQDHPDNTKFCPETGKKLEQLKACSNPECPNYGKYILPLDCSFCPVCGTPISESHCQYDENVKVFNINGVSFKMIKVKAGAFNMGDEDDGKELLHKVTISHDYYIGETVVTGDLVAAIISNKCVADEVKKHIEDECEEDIEEAINYNKEKSSIPVTDFNWYECKWLIRLLRKITGEKFDLPTEAEWEYAERGGHKSENYLYSGSDDIDDVAWYEDDDEYEIQKVSKKEPNELGIYDMSGLVWEWCLDWYEEYEDTVSINPRGPHEGLTKVIRGGSLWDNEYQCRLFYRDSFDPLRSDEKIGFRLVLRLRK